MADEHRCSLQIKCRLHFILINLLIKFEHFAILRVLPVLKIANAASKNKMCPLEIKASGYKTHASLDAFCQKFPARVLWKYLVYTKDYAKDSDIICPPVYMTPFI